MAQANYSHWLVLRTDELFHILVYSKPSSIFQLAATCKSLSQLILSNEQFSNALWKHLYLFYFPSCADYIASLRDNFLEHFKADFLDEQKYVLKLSQYLNLEIEGNKVPFSRNVLLHCDYRLILPDHISHPQKTSSLVKKKDLIIIKDHPCVVIDMAFSKPGKTGRKKVRITGICIFTRKKLEEVYLQANTVYIPVCEFKKHVIVSKQGQTVTIFNEELKANQTLLFPEELNWYKAKQVSVFTCMGCSRIYACDTLL